MGFDPGRRFHAGDQDMELILLSPRHSLADAWGYVRGFRTTNRVFIRDFFAFCKEVLPNDIAEIIEFRKIL